MKKIFVVILAFALLTSSMFAALNIDNENLVAPLPYAKRVVNAASTFPDVPMLSYDDAWANSRPEYVAIGYQFQPWHEIEVNGITDVPRAIGLAANQSMDYVISFFKQTLNFFPKLWDNLEQLVRHWLTPVTVTVKNIASILHTAFVSKDWLACLGLSLIPADWQQIKSENKEVKLPIFGTITAYPFDTYYGVDWK